MSKKKLWNYFPRTISKKQSSDTGMAAILILLLIGLIMKKNIVSKHSNSIVFCN